LQSSLAHSGQPANGLAASTSAVGTSCSPASAREVNPTDLYPLVCLANSKKQLRWAYVDPLHRIAQSGPRMLGKKALCADSGRVAYQAHHLDAAFYRKFYRSEVVGEIV